MALYYVACIIVFSCIFSAFGEKCDYEDQECIKAAVKRIYPSIIFGNASLGIDSSEPLVGDKIVASVPSMNYTLTNLEMHGISGCEVMKAKFRVSDQIWHLYLVCPSLKVKMHYELEGYIAGEKLFGEGDANLYFETYHISFNGKLRKEKRDDGREYIQMTYFEFTRLEATGKADFKFNNLFGNQERSDKMNEFINDNWQEFNSQAQLPAMFKMMSVLIEHFNQYMNKVPVDEIFSKA